MTKTKNRWTIVSKNGRPVRNVATRDTARFFKTPTQKIFDNVNRVFVR